MKTWVAILIGVSILAAVFVIVKAFGPSKTEDSKYFDLYMKSKDREAQLEREWRISNDSIHKIQLAEARQQDTIYINNSKQNAIKYAAIPARINAIPDADLERAIEERFGR